LSFNLFCQAVSDKIPGDQSWDEKRWQVMKKLYEKVGGVFWWDDPDLQNALISAFVLKKGENYEVTEETSLEALVAKRFTKGESAYKKQIKVKSMSTGYTERGKEFDSLVNYLLYIKEGLELPEELTGLASDSIHVFEFYQKFNNNYILGLTGSASTVARRLFEGYGIETQPVPEHFLTQRESSIRLTKDFGEKVEEIEKEVFAKPQSNTIVVVETSDQAAQVAERLIKNGNFELNTLSALNEEDDARLYEWISSAGEKPKMLICVKMIGRGVDVKPDEKVKEKGLLVISTTPFEFERSYLQLIGRVGRRGERGKVITLISPDNNVFSLLPKDQIKQLESDFKKGDKKAVETMLKKAWDKWEDKAVEQTRSWRQYNKPIISLRSWLEGSKSLFPDLKESEAEKIKGFIRENWSNWLWFFEETFKTWIAALPLGPFGQGNIKTVWANYVLDEVRKSYKQQLTRSLPM